MSVSQIASLEHSEERRVERRDFGSLAKTLIGSLEIPALDSFVISLLASAGAVASGSDRREVVPKHSEISIDRSPQDLPCNHQGCGISSPF